MCVESADPERAAIKAAANGDRERLAQVLEGYRPRLTGFVAARLDPQLRRRVDPDDVIQEAFTEVLDRAAELLRRPERRLLGWAWYLTRQRLTRLMRMHLGAAKRDAGREQSGWLPVSSVAIASAFLDRGPSPSQEAVRGEHGARLVEALERLEAIDREVLTLRHFEGLGNSDVAALLELSAEGASMRYARALKRLRRTLGSLGLRSGEALS